MEIVLDKVRQLAFWKAGTRLPEDTFLTQKGTKKNSWVSVGDILSLMFAFVWQ